MKNRYVAFMKITNSQNLNFKKLVGSMQTDFYETLELITEVVPAQVYFSSQMSFFQVDWWILDVNAMPGVIIGSLSVITFFVDLFFLNDLSWKKEKMETLLHTPLKAEDEEKLNVNEIATTAEDVTVSFH